MNIYTRGDGLKVAEVEVGWGMEQEAIEFPVSLAESGLIMLQEFFKTFPKAQRPDLMSAYSYCSDVIENSKKGETTFVLSDFWGETISDINNAIKAVKKEKKKHYEKD